MFVATKVQLGFNIAQVKVVDNTWWFMGSLNYTAEVLRKVCVLLKVVNLRK